MNEDQLAELAAALAADPAYAAGRRRFPQTLSQDDAADLALALCAQVDEGVAARERAARRQGLRIVCEKGCNGCCEEPVMVYLPEALAVARYLDAPEGAAARAAFLAAYPAWRAASGDGPERLAALWMKGDRGAYQKAYEAQWRRRALCAFNQDGGCTVYPVRPMACRNAHAVETHERCSGANVSGPPAARLAFAPLDNYLPGAERVMRAAQHALLPGPPAGPASLCDSVHGLVEP
jgi:Fe-S-cluster containining protein